MFHVIIRRSLDILNKFVALGDRLVDCCPIIRALITDSLLQKRLQPLGLFVGTDLMKGSNKFKM